MTKSKKISFEGKLHIIAAVVLVLSAIMSWMGYGQDIEFHAARMAAIAEEMKNGFGIYRIYTTFCEGYGYASPLFYGDILMYPFALLVALGVRLGVAFRLFLGSIMVASYLTMYGCAKAVWGKRVGVLAAYLYAFSPILLADIFIRYAVGEACAFIFLPLVLLGFYRIVIEPKNQKTDWIVLAVGMSGLIFSHIISTVLTAILLVVLCIFFVKRIWADKKKMLYIVYAALLTVALTAYFTLPMLEQMASSKFYVINRQTSNLAGNVAPLVGLLFGSEYMSVINVILEKLTGQADMIAFSWFPGAFGYIFFFAVFLWFRKKEMVREKISSVFLGCSVVYLIISMVPFVQPLLEPFVGFIKIPWRNLSFYIFFLALAVALMLKKLWEAKKERLYKVGMLLATFGTLVSFLGLAMITVHNGMFPYEELSTTSIGLGEYLPSAVSSYDYSLERGEVADCDSEDVAFDFSRVNGGAELTFSGIDGEATFEVPVYMYLGYTVVNQETGAMYEPFISDNGLVQFTVDDVTEGTVQIYYAGTTLQKVTIWVSAITVVVLIGLWIYLKKKSNQVDNSKMGENK